MATRLCCPINNMHIISDGKKRRSSCVALQLHCVAVVISNVWTMLFSEIGIYCTTNSAGIEKKGGKLSRWYTVSTVNEFSTGSCGLSRRRLPLPMPASKATVLRYENSARARPRGTPLLNDYPNEAYRLQ